MTAADRIEIRGLRVVGTHGVLPEESVRAQPFEVDLDVVTDLRPAGTSGELADTVDYGELTSLVAAVVRDERHPLLEDLATRIADVVLADARVVSVEVAVRKLRPPVPFDMATAGVRITRP